MKDDNTLKVKLIKDGIVIDHIKARKSSVITKILPPLGQNEIRITLENVPSKLLRRKDIVKIESPIAPLTEMITKMVLVSPGITISSINDYDIIEKRKPKIPSEISKSIISCPGCSAGIIGGTATTSGFQGERNVFELIPGDSGEVKIKCTYCGNELIGREIEENLNF
mgnify:CR=1 FL=1